MFVMGIAIICSTFRPWQVPQRFSLVSARVVMRSSIMFRPGTEDALFGSGVVLKVTVIWGGSVTKLYLNDSLVQTVADTDDYAKLDLGVEF